MDDAAIIAVDPMQHPVDLNAVGQSLNNGDHVESAAEGGEPVFELPQTVDMSLDARTVDVDAVLPRAQAVGCRSIGAPAVAQVCAPAHLTAHQWPPAHGGGIELSLLYTQLSFVGFDRGLH